MAFEVFGMKVDVEKRWEKLAAVLICSPEGYWAEAIIKLLQATIWLREPSSWNESKNRVVSIWYNEEEHRIVHQISSNSCREVDMISLMLMLAANEGRVVSSWGENFKKLTHPKWEKTEDEAFFEKVQCSRLRGNKWSVMLEVLCKGVSLWCISDSKTWAIDQPAHECKWETLTDLACFIFEKAEVMQWLASEHSGQASNVTILLPSIMVCFALMKSHRKLHASCARKL